jgi:competence protein ComEA
MPQISRGRALAYGLAVLLVLVFGGRFAMNRDGGEPVADAPAATGTEAVAGALEAAAPEPRVLLVHVVGAVRRPGLFRLADGSRVADAIRRAGGARPKAALELVNLAAPVADGQQVLVPARGRAAPAGTAPAGVSGAGGAPGQKVRLNSATLEELDTLPGVGPVTAQKILDYRTEHGAFQSTDELDAVSGIGPARLAELTPLVDL